MSKHFLSLVLFFLLGIGIKAQLRPALHVDGKYLKDEAGNKVVLHGVGDSPNPSYNDCRWGILCVDDSIPALKEYFTKVFDAVTDKEHGAHANVLRFHLDPVWTNNPNVESSGIFVGEANISRFSANRLKSYMKKVYWPIIADALGHGMYVVVRPPGICQSPMKAGGDYQNYLMTVWDIVSSNDSIQKYSGQISFELANTPYNVLNKYGVDADDALRDFFQPVIDQIRENGFEGILWAPGLLWQSDYRPYVKFPLKDDNLGFAVHDYTTWYETGEGKCDSIRAVEKFAEYVPVVYTNPIMVTEVDWSPENPEAGRYDELGNWIPSNYGTSSTATTTGWGLYYKSVLDCYGNISMTVTASDSYVDIDEYLASGTVRAAYNGVPEACGEPLFEWYKEWSKVNYPDVKLYQDVTDDTDNMFGFSSRNLCSDILYKNSVTEADGSCVFGLLAGGCAGWRYENPVDLSEFELLTFELDDEVREDAALKIYDSSNFWSEPYYVNLKGAGTTVNVPLQDMRNQSGRQVNPANIRIVGLQSASEQSISVKSVSLRLPDAIMASGAAEKSDVIYDLTGRAVSRKDLVKGVYIVNGKKYIAF